MVSNSLRPHGLQHTRLPCLPSPRACSNSFPLSQRCHPTISSYHPLLLLPSIFPSIRVFSNESSLHISQITGASPSASVLPLNIQDSFLLGLTSLMSVKSNGLSIASPTPQFKSISSSALNPLYSPTNISIHQFTSVTQSCPTLCDPTDCSMPGLPAHHQFPELTQTLVH